MKKDKYPKILIISNNALSLTKNNGKTLESFFKTYPSDKLAQLYFNDEEPQSNVCHNFFKISDTMLLNSILHRQKFGNNIQTDTIKNSIKNKSQTKRLIRELLWRKQLWLTDELMNWLALYEPEIIFFMAGDSGFAYNIVDYIMQKFKCKIVTYITDDYVLPHFNLSLAFMIRRKYIKKKMQTIIKKTDLFFTVSEQMRSIYYQLFDRDSIVIRNMTKTVCKKNQKKVNSNLKLTYTGGLNYGRDKIIIAISKAINDFNRENNKCVTFEIYSNSFPDSHFMNQILKDKYSVFGGSINSEELNTVLDSSDVLVFVEDFSKKNIVYTKLSFSTKIPEYIAKNKCILSVGPLSSASIDYLSSFAYSINSYKKIKTGLYKLLSDEKIVKKYASKTVSKYKEIEAEYSSSEIVINNILNINERGKI